MFKFEVIYIDEVSDTGSMIIQEDSFASIDKLFEKNIDYQSLTIITIKRVNSDNIALDTLFI